MLRWLILLWLCLGSAPSNAADILSEFAAHQAATLDGRSFSGNLHVSKGRIRHETTVHGMPEVVIMNPDQPYVVVLMPDRKQFMRLPPRALEQVLTSTFGKRAMPLLEITEASAGKKTDKYRIDSPTGLLYLWAEHDSGKPLRLQSANKQILLAWKQVKPGPQADGLFEIPANYRNFMEAGAQTIPGHDAAPLAHSRSVPDQ